MPTQRPDMSQAQFAAALRKYGIRPRTGGSLGYHDIGGGVSVSILNAGTRSRRRILACLLGEQKRATGRLKREAECQGTD